MLILINTKKNKNANTKKTLIIINTYYKLDGDISFKADRSPLTKSDLDSNKFIINIFCIKPYFALTAFNDIFFCFKLIIYNWQVFPKINNIFILLSPVTKHLKL